MQSFLRNKQEFDILFTVPHKGIRKSIGVLAHGGYIVDRIRKILSDIVPRHGVFPLILAVALNFSVYFGTRIIAGGWHHYNIESPLDRMIPLWPPSVAVYFGCYLFWVVNYILIARQDKTSVCQFFSADFISRIVCMVFYLAFPTTNTRPRIEADGFWNQIMLLLYETDAADNLFPSIHCLVSWFCYIGLRGKKNISAGYRAASCIMAILVCVSTLTTKQHVLIDVAGGILLAEICVYIGKRPTVWGTYEKLLDKVNKKIFGNEGN